MARVRRNFGIEVNAYLQKEELTGLIAEMHRGTISIKIPAGGRTIYWVAGGYRASYESEVIVAINETIAWIERYKPNIREFLDVHKQKMARQTSAFRLLPGYTEYGSGLTFRGPNNSQVTLNANGQDNEFKVQTNGTIKELEIILDVVKKDIPAIEEYFREKSATQQLTVQENTCISNLMRMR